MVSFPRPLPDVQFINTFFELQRFISTAKSAGQLINIIEYADPCWKFRRVLFRSAETRHGKLAAINNGNELTVATVNAGLILSAGDYVSLQYDKYYALTRVVDATGHGTNRTIVIEPNLPGYIQTGATVLFDRAELLMRLDTTSVTQWSRDNENVSFTFIESRL